MKGVVVEVILQYLLLPPPFKIEPGENQPPNSVLASNYYYYYYSKEIITPYSIINTPQQ